MDRDQVIAYLKSERDRLDGAIAALEGGAPASHKQTDNVVAKRGRRGRRKISAAGLARIRAAQKARWAKVRAGK